MEQNIEVPSSAIAAFLDVRETGLTNMFDSNAVLYYMNELEHHEAVVWLAEVRESGTVRANKPKYAALLKAVNDHFRITHMLVGDNNE